MQNSVKYFTFDVMSFCPIVARSGLPIWFDDFFGKIWINSSLIFGCISASRLLRVFSSTSIHDSTEKDAAFSFWNKRIYIISDLFSFVTLIKTIIMVRVSEATNLSSDFVKVRCFWNYDQKAEKSTEVNILQILWIYYSVKEL